MGLDGINLDFELITEEQGAHYVQFIRELSVACKNTSSCNCRGGQSGTDAIYEAL